MTTKDYSLDGFNKFLDYVVDKGLMKPDTAKGRKRAANAILGILGPDECSDLRSIDIDQVAQRFANLQGSEFKPASLREYQNRTRSALADFFDYVEDPISFKPSAKQRKRKGAENGEKPTKKASGRSSRGTAKNPVDSHDKTDTHDKLVFPIPIRPGLIVEVSNIPEDLTSAEANKISAVVSALAVASSE